MEKAYEVEYDNLVLSGHDIDIKLINIDMAENSEAGVIERGQVLDLTEEGKYTLHASEGDVNCIVAQPVEYTAEDKEVTAKCYITGEFRTSEVKAEVELTDKDVERFREKGIILS